MKPDWDKLMKNFNKGKRAQHGLIADVDCTTEGKDLCEKHGVQGFPSIKWGDPDALEDYDGGRDYDSLKAFAKANIKPLCSPANLDLCDDEKKAKITELQELSAEDLATKIEEKQKEMKEAEETFEAEVKKLQETYQQLQKTKDETVAAVKSSGLGLMISVQSHAKKAKEEL
mmetsp:Transcript_105104/g.255159  ORF Transcript_105104/g.255159 Transcript_105104/m.255159 type:complete len:172 (-) Transcript_105104:260-775(-)